MKKLNSNGLKYLKVVFMIFISALKPSIREETKGRNFG